ncbi:hypothetical protein HII36_29505 [Nonomuraea sp. NN258]|uniref:AAA family ATPase n=1 Tax=Nonomuraea antri TaxID=2730852 RepID=UPI0015692693|nr:AAA family ATPase [Nonomuraea antri]NRQ35939.1 hypothetical protein [Nonomuraea antri]
MTAVEAGQAERMRAGVRARVARGAGLAGRELRRMSPPALIATLCAAALAPVLAVSMGGVAAAGLGVLGSVGANVLTEVVVKAIDGLKGRPAGADEIEREVAERIATALPGPRGQALRADLARMLTHIDAMRVVIATSVEQGDAELQEHLTESFAELSAKFAEFGALRDDLRDAMWAINEGLLRQDAERQLDRERWLRQFSQLRLVQDRLEVIERQTGHAVGDPDAEPARWWHGPPYKGLRAFEEEDAEIFYGRQALTAELVGRLAETLAGGRALVMTGPSGAGKSSLLRAGLLSALARNALGKGSSRWPRILFTPTATPLDELALHLALVGGLDALTVRATLADHPERAWLLARQAVLAATRNEPPGLVTGLEAGRVPGRLVVAVDQFEELFEAEQEQAEAFVHALTALAGKAPPIDEPPPVDEPSALVVLAVRGDCWDRLTAYPRLAALLRGGPFLVRPMDEAELRMAISGPAAAAGLTVEPGLVDAVLTEIRSWAGHYESGALPLLSQAMLAAWGNREGDRLTIKAYAVAGGVSHAVENSAEAVYGRLSEAGKSAARDVFSAMTAIRRGGGLVRRRVERAELYRVGHDRAEVDALLETFAAERLVLLSADGSTATAEPAHDVLLRVWPRLRHWLRDDEAGRVLYGQLLDDAAEWRRQDGDPAFLYRGGRLAMVRRAMAEWAAAPERHPSLTGESRDFLRASVQRRRWSLGSVAVLLAVTLAGGGVAVNQSLSAWQEKVLRVARQTAARAESLRTRDPVRAMALSLAAWRIADTRESRAALNTSLAHRVSQVVAIPGLTTHAQFDLNGDGTVLAVVDQGRATRWDTAGGRPIGQASYVGPGVTAIALSPDGRTLATAGESSLRLWSLDERRPLTPPFGSGAKSLSYEAGLLAVVTPGMDRWQVWDPRTGKTLLDEPGPDVGGLTVAAHGRVAAATMGGSFVVRELATRKVLLRGRGDAVGLSPDGTTLAVGDGADVRFFDLATAAEHETRLPAADAALVTYSPDGRLVATVDGTSMTLWTPDGRRVLSHSLIGFSAPTALRIRPGTARYALLNGEVATLDLGHHAMPARRVTSAALDPAATTAALIDEKGLWLRRGARAPEFVTAGAETAAFSPDGRWLAVGLGAPARVELWSVAARTRAAVLPVTDPVRPPQSVKAFAFSPDGRTLAVAPWSGGWGRIQLWDVRSHRRTGFLAHAGAPHLAFGPDGRALAVDGPDSALVAAVPGARAGGALGTAGDDARSVAFSADGRLVATGLASSGVTLWDTATHEPVGHLPTLRAFDATTALAFSPDDGTLAVGTAAGDVRLWDVEASTPIGQPYERHAGQVEALVFSPDGGTLHSIGEDASVQRYPIDPAQVAKAVCARAGHPSLTEAEWHHLIPEMAYRKVCPS